METDLRVLRLQVCKDHVLYDLRRRQLRILRRQFPGVWAQMKKDKARAAYVRKWGDDEGFEGDWAWTHSVPMR